MAAVGFSIPGCKGGAPVGIEGTASSTAAAPASAAAAKKITSGAAAPTAEDLAKIGAAYGIYVRADKKEDKDDKDATKIYRFSLEAGTFACNGSNYKVERKSFQYFVVSASTKRFTIGFDSMSARRTLTFSYDGNDKVSLDEGVAPGECRWSLESGSWERTEKAEGAAPTEVRPIAKSPSPSKEKVAVKLSEDAEAPKGAVRGRSFSWTKAIGFAKAEKDEKFGQFRFEVRNSGDESIDFELSYTSCEDIVSFRCETGSDSGDASACERPHFGDETPNGLLVGGKKATINCCRKFDKDAKDCHAKVDMRALGGGVADIDLGK